MAHLYKAGDRRKVVFLHVPANVEPEVVNSGKEVVLQLIRSIVESELSRKGANRT